jgi:hypothetical protein
MARFAQFERIDGHFAFATAAGVTDLMLVLDEAARHNETPTARQRWLVSLDFGHTEPDALRQLMSVARSEVRVMDSAHLLRRQLQPRVVFHPKTLVLTAGRVLPIGASVGSGNLTRSGLRVGREHAVVNAVAEPVANHSERLDGTRLRGLLRLMGQDWQRADVLTDRLLTRYEAVRLTRAPSPQNAAEAAAERLTQPADGLPLDQLVALRRDGRFWIETGNMYANRGTGQPGNQLDLRRGTRAFFGFSTATRPNNSPIGQVGLLFRGHLHRRNLRFGDNSMDKLDLPALTPAVNYANQTVLFTRQPRGTYRCELLPGRRAHAVKAQATTRGTQFAMAGGRKYGTLP